MTGNSLTGALLVVSLGNTAEAGAVVVTSVEQIFLRIPLLKDFAADDPLVGAAELCTTFSLS